MSLSIKQEIERDRAIKRGEKNIYLKLPEPVKDLKNPMELQLNKHQLKYNLDIEEDILESMSLYQLTGMIEKLTRELRRRCISG